MMQGHNIVAGGSAGASDTPPQHTNIPKEYQKHSFLHFLTRSIPTDGRTAKVSYRVACQQLKRRKNNTWLWIKLVPYKWFLITDTRLYSLYTMPCRSFRPKFFWIASSFRNTAPLKLSNRPWLECRVSGLVDKGRRNAGKYTLANQMSTPVRTTMTVTLNHVNGK